MATKTTITTITGDYGSKDLINANFVALADAIDLLVSRDGEAPNTMLANLDMNSYKLINVLDPTNNQDAATKIYVDNRIATGAANAAAAAASAAAALASETAASGYATDADTARGLAVVAQGLAETAQAAAELALDSFDDRYLGAKAADPTLDNDGDPLLTGAIYFNSVLGQMKVYSGATWSIVPQIVGIVSNADATAITIDSNENVGIGHTPNTAGANYVNLQVGPAVTLMSHKTSAFGYLFSNMYFDGTDYRFINSSGACRLAMNDVGVFSFASVATGTAGGIATYTEKMRIDGAGNVTQSGGVTYLNGGQLIVARSGNEPYVYFDYGGTEVGQVRGISGGGLRFTTGASATERMRIDSAGNVGIGVVPEAWNSTFDALQVGGLGSIFATASQAAGGATDIGSNVYYDGAWKYIVTDEASRYRQDSGTHQFFTAPSGTADTAITWTERMRIDSAGNVGIGATAPNYRVHLHENSSGSNYLQFTNTTTGSTNANGFIIGADGSEHARLHNYHNSDMIFATNAIERMRIDSTGSVGIEGGQLNLYQTGAINSIINAKYSCRINIDSTNIGTGEYFSIGHNQTTINSSNELFRVQEDGNVGIGTTSPQYPLDVQSTTTNGIRITSTDAGAAIGPIIALWRNSASPAASDALAAIYFQGEDSVSNATNYARINAYIEDPTDGTEDGALTFSTSRASVLTEAVRITGSGDVGIGVTPTYPLHLQKSINGYLVRFQNTSASTPYGVSINFSGASPDNNTQSFLNCNDSTTTRCIIYSDGDLANHDGTYGTISDAKFKTDITPARSQWEDIKALGAIAVNYRMKTDIEQYGEDAHYLLGWIAQDVQKVSPGLVKEAGDPEDPYLVLKQSIIGNKVAIALAEALVRIEQLESTIASLQQQ